VHSYKGGVGKSTVAALLGLILGESRRVCLVDLDLLAPGLHHLLQMSPPEKRVLDYLVAGGDSGAAASVSEMCIEDNPGIEGAQDMSLWLVAGKPELSRARTVQSYLLADAQTRLLAARLEHMLRQIKRVCEVDLFILDTPPSLFGTSGSVQALTARHGGVRLFVATPILQDLTGTYALLDQMSGEGEAGNAGRDGRAALIFNRCDWVPEGGSHEDDLVALIARAHDSGGGDRDLRETIRHWVEHFQVACIEELSDTFGAMGSVSPQGHDRPSLRLLMDDAGGLVDLGLRLAEEAERG